MIPVSAVAAAVAGNVAVGVPVAKRDGAIESLARVVMQGSGEHNVKCRVDAVRFTSSGRTIHTN